LLGEVNQLTADAGTAVTPGSAAHIPNAPLPPSIRRSGQPTIRPLRLATARLPDTVQVGDFTHCRASRAGDSEPFLGHRIDLADQVGDARCMTVSSALAVVGNS
jgi:hypothetical protein